MWVLMTWFFFVVKDLAALIMLKTNLPTTMRREKMIDNLLTNNNEKGENDRCP